MLRALRSFSPSVGDEALVVGAGFMGVLNALALRRLFGVVSSITDTNEERLRLPAELGIRTLRESELAGGRFDAVIVTPPVPALVPQYARLVAPSGHLVLFGGYAKGATIELDPNLVHYDGLKVLGTSGFAPDDFKAAVKAIANGLIDLSPFTKELYAFADFDRAFADALEGRALKAGFELGGRP